jgi:hypothetical protein
MVLFYDLESLIHKKCFVEMTSDMKEVNFAASGCKRGSIKVKICI